jgi:acetyl-CoA C-acetyltransferase
VNRAVLVEAVRTPFGKRMGALRGVPAAALLGHTQKAVLRRAGLESVCVGQIVGGCVTQVGEQSFNITRTAWLHAGLAYCVGATTIDSQCGSSQQANHIVDAMIRSGAIDVGIACGVEAMTRVPMGSNASASLGRALPEGFRHDMSNQFVAAERVAKKHGITREAADRLGLASQLRAAAATRDGHLQGEIEPLDIATVTISADEGLRATSGSALAQLRPILTDGIHTAGNTSQISDGAATLLWMNEDLAHALGLKPRARIFSQALVGTDPYYHIEGPLDVTRALLRASRLSLSDIDVFEINEAFAAVVLAWLRTFNIEDTRVNINGGAIALGHPMGATGARLIMTALHQLERLDREFALIAMCGGGAVATGTILQRC